HRAAGAVPQPRLHRLGHPLAAPIDGAGRAGGLPAALLQGVLGVSATSAGEAITPLTLSSVIGAMIAGILVSTTKRYQAVSIVGALVMAVGVFMLTRVTPQTDLTLVIVYMVIAGLGIGPFFSVLTIAAQNALPRERLGIGTSAVRYLGQLGGALGVAI